MYIYTYIYGNKFMLMGDRFYEFWMKLVGRSLRFCGYVCFCKGTHGLKEECAKNALKVVVAEIFLQSSAVARVQSEERKTIKLQLENFIPRNRTHTTHERTDPEKT